MRYLFILGTSGSGKTTLARKIEKYYPKKFKKIVQYTTRQIRPNETDGYDYHFTDHTKFESLDLHEHLTGVVKEEFNGDFYGSPYADMEEDKINILVLSAEGFLDALNKSKFDDIINVLYIANVNEAEAKRDGRDFLQEQKYTSIIIHKILECTIKKINYVEIDHLVLKEIRNNRIKIIAFLREKGII